MISPLIQPLASELLKIMFFIISIGISYSINLTFIVFFFPKVELRLFPGDIGVAPF